MAQSLTGSPNRDHFSPECWDSIDSACKSAFSILNRHFGNNKHIASGDLNQWLTKMTDILTNEMSSQVEPTEEQLSINSGISIALEFVFLLVTYLDSPEVLNVNYAFLLGSTAQSVHLNSMASKGVYRAIGSDMASRAQRSGAGRAGRSLTEAQERIALELIRECMTPGVSKTAACIRASAKLAAGHTIEVSYKTLVRLWDSPPES